MIKKIVNFIESDGWGNTFRFILKPIIAKFKKESKTIILYATGRPNNFEYRDIWNNYSLQIVTDASVIEEIHFPRLKYNPYHKWLSDGSICYLLYYGPDPIGFGWIHFNDHYIDHVGTFELSKHSAYIGPSFVHKKHRGKGLQKLILAKRMIEAPLEIKSFITCINSHNIASLRSNNSVGFKEGGTSIYYIKNKNAELLINEDALDYIKLKK